MPIPRSLWGEGHKGNRFARRASACRNPTGWTPNITRVIAKGDITPFPEVVKPKVEIGSAAMYNVAQMKRTKLTVFRERAILVGAEIGDPGPDAHGDRLEELAQLAQTAGAVVMDRVVQHKQKIDSATYIGSGKAKEVADLAVELDANVIIFDNDLSPAQMRNLENIVKHKVVDRTELILDIFATHAKTRQAKLQVELAQLEYALPRLKRMWTHLSRIEGGVGIGQRGPGEKQIEVDRRLARKRVKDLKTELASIESRKQREVAGRSENFTVALVGYTNAGKSTLMNALSGTSELVEDKLFSTLDTKTHVCELPDGQKVLLSDTVGFIRDLPHQLVASFHATLEEVLHADLLVHVVDASSPNAAEQIGAVNSVLAKIGCAKSDVLVVFNKVDLLADALPLQLLRRAHADAVEISALCGHGLDRLGTTIAGKMRTRQVEVALAIPVADGKVLAEVAASGKILSKKLIGETMSVRVLLPRRGVSKLEKYRAS
jgi:GTP-binding protein HflX